MQILRAQGYSTPALSVIPFALQRPKMDDVLCYAVLGARCFKHLLLTLYSIAKGNRWPACQS